jgi:SAM-dependent methyltransferase
MEQATYEIEARVEREHWWFKTRRKLLAQIIDGLALPPAARVLDVGCGTGANGPVLAGGDRFAIGVDASPIPLRVAGERGHAVRARADATRLPFANASFDLAVALDVLEHIDDDRAAARELFRVVKPGGALILFVPALELLWGLQDEVSHHRRRYAREELVALAAGAGFAVERTTFFNTLLFLPILAARLAMRVRPPKNLKSENELGGAFTNRLLGGVFGMELPMLARFDLPVGVSLALIARKR